MPDFLTALFAFFSGAIGLFFPTAIGTRKSVRYLLYFFLLCTLGISLYKWYDQEQKDKKAIQEANARQDTLTRKITRGIDSGISVNNKTLALAFKQQGIDLDSLKNEVRLRSLDTLKPTVNNTYISPSVKPDVNLYFGEARATDPSSLPIRLDSINKKKYSFSVSIICRDAPAEKINLLIRSAFGDENQKFFPVEGSVIQSLPSMQKDNLSEMTIGINAPQENFSTLYLYFRSTYFDINGSQMITREGYQAFDIMKRKNYGADNTTVQRFKAFLATVK